MGKRPIKWVHGYTDEVETGGYEVVFIYVCVFSCAQLFATPWTVARQAPLSMECPRHEYWSGFPFPPRGDLLNSGIEPMSPISPALQGDA